MKDDGKIICRHHEREKIESAKRQSRAKEGIKKKERRVKREKKRGGGGGGRGSKAKRKSKENKRSGQ